jgi:branched-chain amino acid transport system ATP-binding protein
MHKGARVLHDEHLAIAAVMQALQHLARLAQEPGVKADFRAFHAMIHYIDAFPERLHHPKEDQVLFARLWDRSAEARPLVERLKAEHVEGARLVRDLEAAVRKYEQAWPRGAQDFAAAVQAYADFHWRHMRSEEQELLPLAERALSEEDWAAVERAFAQNEDPIADLHAQDFDRLYARILSLAPAPIGLGDPWKRA